jgi:hypothetical protein
MAEKGKKAKPKKMTPHPTKGSSIPKVKPRKDLKTASAKATNIATKATAAYDDLRPAPPPKLGNIPWGYGDVRIVGMARDPNWACAYWEISDDSIKAAQEKLQDSHAGLSLRVYDTTDRDFNGLNAHLHWDLGIDRNTNVYHFKVGKPGTTIHVDVGVRKWDGGFQPIARSNAVEMPRDSVSPHTRVEATTVFRSGPAFTYRHRYHPPPAHPSPAPPSRFESTYPAESEQMFKHLSSEGWSRSEWMETMIDGRVMRWIRWSGPIMAEHLPFLPKTGASYRTVEVLFQGERRIIKMEGGEKIVYGPWKVVVEAVGGEGQRKTIEQWMIRQRWTTHEGMMRVETPAILTRILGGRRVTIVQSGSEARLAQEEWGSQVLQQGASEWRWIGASENMLQGSSETLQRGASEIFYLGSSERIYQGSSETIYLGASETLGASEMMGASEMLYLGASDTFDLGSSENSSGASRERP